MKSIFTIAVLVAVLMFCATAYGSPTTMTVAAHQDDSILFMSPDVLHDVQQGRGLVSVVVTAGDAGGGNMVYVNGREAGALAAYATMANVPDQWTEQTVVVAGHPMTQAVLTGDPRVVLYFLRLPNKMLDPNAPDVWYPTQLSALERGWIPSLTTVDGAATYTRQDVVGVLLALMGQYQPDRVDTQDFVGRYGWGDHADHRATAFMARNAWNAYNRGELVSYLGYNDALQPQNVTGADLQQKTAVYMSYAPHDPLVPSADKLQQSIYGSWLGTQYQLTTVYPAYTVRMVLRSGVRRTATVRGASVGAVRTLVVRRFHPLRILAIALAR